MLANKPVKGFLLDVTGVLYNTNHSGGAAIPGSIEAVKKLYHESKVRFLSNESTETRQDFVAKLNKLGFQLRVDDVITPAPVTVEYLKTNGLRPHLLVADGVLPEFADCNTDDPNCVVMADAEDNFTYDRLNAAFRLLHASPELPLVTLGNGRFYQRTDGPCLDVGCFRAALQYATGCRHVQLGKPAPEYFARGLASLGIDASEAVMIGDDIIGDVGGAQAIGIRGVQLRTGKWIPAWENHHAVKPDLIADNLLAAVNSILNASS